MYSKNTSLFRQSLSINLYLRRKAGKKPQTIEQKLLAREERLKAQKNYYTVDRAELAGFRSNLINKSFMKKALGLVNTVLNTNRLTKQMKEKSMIKYGKFKVEEYQYYEYLQYLKHLKDPRLSYDYLKNIREEFDTLPYKLQTDMIQNKHKKEEYPIKMHPSRLHMDQKAHVLPKSQFYKHLLNVKLEDIQEGRVLKD